MVKKSYKILNRDRITIPSQLKKSFDWKPGDDLEIMSYQNMMVVYKPSNNNAIDFIDLPQLHKFLECQDLLRAAKKNSLKIKSIPLEVIRELNLTQ